MIGCLFDLPGISLDVNELLVEPMTDGGVGSLKFAPFDTSRRYGSHKAECHFFDADGVPVLASLVLDENGVPFEIDVWKGDFMPTTAWPSRKEVHAGFPVNSQPVPPIGAE